MTPISRLAAVPFLLIAAAIPFNRCRADALWDGRPYEVLVAIEASESGLAQAQRGRLAAGLAERLNTRLAGFWRVRHEEPQGEDAPAIDKRIEIAVEQSGGGYALRCLEHDLTIGDQSPKLVLRATCTAALPERLYTAALATFRPLAVFQRDPEDPLRVTLAYRAARLSPGGQIEAAAQGQLLAPYRRRMGRDGAVGEVQLYPWTYLVAESPEQAGASVVSHSRRPFGSRPSGRVEQLAIVTPIDRSTRSHLRLQALGDPETVLPGYEVSLGRPGETALTPLGFTDERGRVDLPDVEGVWMAHVKCGALVVASVPVAPGVADEISVSLIDERSRLRAELEVTSLREELVDTVARRKILAGRINRFLGDDRIDDAKRLLRELDDLPGKTQFERRLEAAQRGAEATHPVAKARLDQLFSKTLSTMSRALDPREVRELAIAVDRAEQAVEIRESAQQPAQGG